MPVNPASGGEGVGGEGEGEGEGEEDKSIDNLAIGNWVIEEPPMAKLPIAKLPMILLFQGGAAVEDVEQPRALPRWRARETHVPVSHQHA